MTNTKYERNIGGYSFVMANESTIEVWIDSSGEHPDCYITVKPGSINSQKAFDQEISWWHMKNVG